MKENYQTKEDQTRRQHAAEMHRRPETELGTLTESERVEAMQQMMRLLIAEAAGVRKKTKKTRRRKS